MQYTSLTSHPSNVTGLEEVLVVTKSQLELEKEAAAKVAGGPAATESPRPPPGSPADKVCSNTKLASFRQHSALR